MDRSIRSSFRESVALTESAVSMDPTAREEALRAAAAMFLATYTQLKRAREQRNLLRGCENLTSPELLVLAAEAAVKNKRFDIAAEVTRTFFLDAGGTEDQFLCRTLFVQALVEGHAAEPLHGAAGVQRRRLAVSYVLHALRIATAEANRPRYDFLVYNLSLIHISEPTRPY